MKNDKNILVASYENKEENSGVSSSFFLFSPYLVKASSWFKEYLINGKKLVRDSWLPALIIGFSALYFHEALTLKYVNFVIALSVGYGFAYGLNDYFDRHFDVFDEHKARRNYYVNKQVNRSFAKLFVALLFSYFALTALFVGTRGIIVLVIALVVSWIYSAPPMRIKNKPGLDILVHSSFVLTFPYVATIYVLEASLGIRDFTIILLTFLGSAIVQLENQVRDYELDKLFEKNFTIVLGKSASSALIALSNIVLGIVFVGAIWLDILPRFLLIFALGYAPLFFHRLIRPGKIRSEKAIRRILIIEGVLLLLFVFWFFVGI